MNVFVSPFKTKLGFLAAFLVLALLLSGCGKEGDGESQQSGQAGHDIHEGHRAANGDLQETTASLDELPAFLDGQHEVLVQAYQVAAQYADVIEYMPCYCGCGESAGHRSNKMCFINEIREDGSVVWDDHGTRCNVCVETAVLSAQMDNKGASLKEIREFIDTKYSEGYAAPTRTVMPD